MSIAHYFTFFRIFIGPIFLFLYLEHESLNISLSTLPYILLGLFGVSELSDAMDGYLARKYDQVTDLGKILDPMADSIYRTSMFLTFTLPPINLPIVLVFVFIYRDSVISTLRTICALKGFTLAARPSGKLKAFIQAAAAFLVLVLLIPYSWGHLSQETLEKTSTWLVSIAALYTFFSGIEYIYTNRIFIQRLADSKPKTEKQAILKDGYVAKR